MREIPTLETGESVDFRHGSNDFRAQIRFSLAGWVQEHRDEYVDLWTGEGWLLDTGADGVVDSGHASYD